ncbi:hypothetical protein BDZ91DRAFT_455982 [Kalaharituber pfeilii]|nr:hypothetical protein BDZ91DRAFT_455982 [Kalaharituber pfeilii]
MLACKFRFSDYTVPMPKMTFEVGLTGAHSNAGAGTGVKDVGEQRPVVYAGNVLCRGAADITPSEGVIARAMKIRSELGMVCNLHSPTQAVVLPLANAIVGAMEVLFPQGPSNVNNSAHGLSNAHPPEATKLWHNSSQESILDVTMSVETIFTAIPITLTQANAPTAADYYPLRLTYQHARGLWRIDLTQVEALLSLYMYSTRTHHVESECLERRFATKATSTFRPPSSVSDGDNLCLDLFGDSSKPDPFPTLSRFYKQHFQNLQNQYHNAEKCDQQYSCQD